MTADYHRQASLCLAALLTLLSAPRAIAAAGEAAVTASAAAATVGEAAAAADETLGTSLRLGELSASPVLSFPEALKMIKDNSTAIKRAGATVAIASEREKQSESIYLPDVTATGREVGSGNDHGALTTEQGVGLGVSVNLYRFGGDEAKRQGVKAEVDASAYGLKAAAEATELEAAQAIFDVIQRAKERDIARAVLAINQESLALVQRLFARGVRPEQEVEKVSIDTANVQAQLADNELNFARANATLNALAGQPVLVQTEWPWRTFLSRAAPALPTPDLHNLAERRAIAEHLNSLDALLTTYAVKRLPSLDLTSGFDISRITERDPNLGYNVAGLNQRKWSTAIVLTVPLFDRYAARTDLAEQVLLKSQVEMDLITKDRQLESDLQEATTGFQAGLSSALTRELTAAQARKLYERSLKNFKAGVVSANDLSLDQGRLYNTQLNVVHGWATVHQYLARLCHLLNQPLTSCSTALFHREAEPAAQTTTSKAPAQR